MLKKIEEARKQAQRMEDTREANNSRYKFMMEFRMKQHQNNEELKQKNAEMKSQRSIKYQQRKADILRKNQQDYQMIREQRAKCLDEKYNI